MRRVFLWLALTAAPNVTSPVPSVADKLQCPDAEYCPVPGFEIGGGQCTISSIPDMALGGGKNRGEWKFSCTNQAETGDFVWIYDESGAKGPKEIGRCVYFQGRNYHEYVRDSVDQRQILYYLHVVRNSKNHVVVGDEKHSDPGNERTIHVFSKLTNSGVEIRETLDKQTNQWTEVERRTFTSLDLPPGGGTIPRVKQEAEYSTSLRLVGFNGASGLDLRWSVFQGLHNEAPFPNPVLKPGDSIYLDGLTLTALRSFDPRFNPSSTPTGIQLTANTFATLNHNSILATITRPAATGIFYSVNAGGATSFIASLLAGARFERDLQNSPGYAANAGVIDLSTVVPAATPWGLAGLALLLVGASVFAFLRRRGASA
jgi:hypothetical protein